MMKHCLLIVLLVVLVKGRAQVNLDFGMLKAEKSDGATLEKQGFLTLIR